MKRLRSILWVLAEPFIWLGIWLALVVGLTLAFNARPAKGDDDLDRAREKARALIVVKAKPKIGIEETTDAKAGCPMCGPKCNCKNCKCSKTEWETTCAAVPPEWREKCIREWQAAQKPAYLYIAPRAVVVCPVGKP